MIDVRVFMTGFVGGCGVLFALLGMYPFAVLCGLIAVVIFLHATETNPAPKKERGKGGRGKGAG